MEVHAGKKSQDVLDYLLQRRSSKIDDLVEPGPSADEIETILTAAARVPDHGRMVPFYFLIIQGEARTKIGNKMAALYEEQTPDARADKIQNERDRFNRAPLIIAVISRARKGKKPIWEQLLCAGAVCHNASLAAHALGYGVNWVTEWPAFDAQAKTYLGLDHRDHVAGFLYIGTASAQQDERPRPDLSHITTTWDEGITINKGDDAYDQEKIGFPEKAFDFDRIEE